MKRIGIFISILFLSALVVLGSGHITIGKMICGGNECASEYSLGVAKDCCDDGSSSEELRSCCCELINVSYSLDDFNFSQQLKVADQGPIFCNLAYSSGLPVVASSILAFVISDFDPPETRELLFTFRSLLL